MDYSTYQEDAGGETELPTIPSCALMTLCLSSLRHLMSMNGTTQGELMALHLSDTAIRLNSSSTNSVAKECSRRQLAS